MTRRPKCTYLCVRTHLPQGSPSRASGWQRGGARSSGEKGRSGQRGRKTCTAGPLKYSPPNQRTPSQPSTQIDFLPTGQTVRCRQHRSPHDEAEITTGSSLAPRSAPPPVGKVSSHVGGRVSAGPLEGCTVAPGARQTLPSMNLAPRGLISGRLCWGVPKTTLGLDDPLEGLKRHKSCCAPGYHLLQ